MTDTKRDAAGVDVEAAAGGGGNDNVPPVVAIGVVEDNSPSVEKPVERRSAKAEHAKVDNTKWYILGGIAAVVILFAIIFPIVWTQTADNRTDSTSTSSASTVNVGSTNDGSPTATDSNTQVLTGAEEAPFKMVPGGSGPFNSTLNLFSSDIAKGYSSVDELRYDLEQAAWFLLNEVVKRNTGTNWNGGGSIGVPYADVAMDGGRGVENDMVTSDQSAAMPMPGAAPPEMAKGVPSDLTDFGTNNQEADVEEGDVVVSDGEYVYAAYSDYLIIWNARDGTMVAQIRMPTPQDLMPKTDSSSAKSRMPDYYYWNRPRIQNLVLFNGRLLVVMDGYGNVVQQLEGFSNPIVYDSFTTHLRLYNTADLVSGSGTPIGTTNVHGRFGEVRAVDGNAHVMTVSDLQAYSILDGPFSRYNFPWFTKDEDYIAEVYRIAKEHAVPFFVNKLVNELVPDGETLPNLARISLWQTENSNTELESKTYTEGVLNSIAYVHSLDMTTNDEELDINSSGAFLPSSWAKFYGAPGSLIIAGQGWNYDSETSTSTQTTYFLGFDLDGASSTPRAVGKVDGYLLNNYALDIVGDVLRVATSIQNSWIVRPIMREDGTNTTEIVQAESRTQNYVILLELPDLEESSNIMMKELGRLQLGKPNELFTAVRFFDNIAYAVTFERKDPFYVLDLDDPSNPEILAELEITGFSSYLHSMNADNTLILAIGEEADEDGNILGVQVTVFDMRDPANPIPAVRHTIEESTDVYSSSRSLDDFKATRYAGERLIIPMDIWSYQSSDAQEFHGFFTYFVNATTIYPECKINFGSEQKPDVETTPVVSVDMTVTANSSVTNDETIAVIPEMESSAGFILPSEPMVDSCYYCANLPPRSMIFDGNLMTMNNHFIRSNDMNTCSQKWALNIKINNTDGDCCGAFWY